MNVSYFYIRHDRSNTMVSDKRIYKTEVARYCKYYP